MGNNFSQTGHNDQFENEGTEIKAKQYSIANITRP